MNNLQLTQLRNFFFKAFMIGFIAFIILLVGTFLIWDTWSAFIYEMVKVDESTLGKLVVNSFLLTRIVIIFLFLVPAIALHLLIKKMK